MKFKQEISIYSTSNFPLLKTSQVVKKTLFGGGKIMRGEKKKKKMLANEQ